MNILFYLHQFPAIGGIETVTATLANQFVCRGYCVSILSHTAKDNGGELDKTDIRVEFFRMPDSSKLDSLRNARYLQRVVTNKRIDIIVFQDSYARIEINLFRLQQRPRVVTVEHSSPFFANEGSLCRYKGLMRLLWRFRHPLLSLGRNRLECNRRRRLYAFSDRYVMLSNRFFGEFRMLTGLYDIRKLRSIANPITDKISTGESVKRNVVLFCGSLNRLKGCDMLLKAWARISRETDWLLQIVGDGPERSSLEAAARDLVNVEFLGYKTNPSMYFAQAKIFAFPSRREGWGLVLVEAMSNGCVPVAFESYSAVHDIIEDGVDGYVVPAFDEDKYVRRVLELMNDSSKLAIMQNNAKQKASIFSVERVAEKWECLFEEINTERESADQ